MSLFSFFKVCHEFLKRPVVLIYHSFGNTGQPGRINTFTDAFKLSIDVQLGAIELVTPVLAKTQI